MRVGRDPCARAGTADAGRGARARARGEGEAARTAPARPCSSARLLALENDRLFERILSPAEGFYPKIGNITPGQRVRWRSRLPHPAASSAMRSISARLPQVSIQKYWMLDARLTMPELAGGRLFADVYARRYDYPGRGLLRHRPAVAARGPHDLRPAEHRRWRHRRRPCHAVVVLRRRDFDFMTPRVAGLPRPAGLPSPEVSAEINTRQPRGNPRQGGRYALDLSALRRLWTSGGRSTSTASKPTCSSTSRSTSNRRVLALRGAGVGLRRPRARDVPFYFQRTLGGPDDLRGFRQFRFRDRNMLLLQAEYRWEIFTAVDGAIFYDAGKVASRIEDLELRGPRVRLRHRLPLRHLQRRVPPRRGRVRQQRRRAFHPQVRPCLLDRGRTTESQRHRETQERACVSVSLWLVVAGRVVLRRRPRRGAALLSRRSRSRWTTTWRSMRARRRRSRAATATTSPSTRSSTSATAATSAR